MRLLSFLSDIERAVVSESPVVDGGAWESARIVNFEKGLGRLTLTPRAPDEVPFSSGAILLQAFALADGSQCMKATLSWIDSEVTRVMAVYSTPQLNWKLEASRIASTWLEGAPAAAATSEPEFPSEGISPLGATG